MISASLRQHSHLPTFSTIPRARSPDKAPFSTSLCHINTTIFSQINFYSCTPRLVYFHWIYRTFHIHDNRSESQDQQPKDIPDRQRQRNSSPLISQGHHVKKKKWPQPSDSDGRTQARVAKWWWRPAMMVEEGYFIPGMHHLTWKLEV